MNAKILFLTSLPLMTMRVAWYAWPSLAMSVAFWGGLLLVIACWSAFLRKRAIPRHCVAIAAIGASLNAIVIMFNGGYMPVHGKPAEFQEGVWRSAEQGGHFLFLADRMSLGGASPGDFFLLAGVMVGVSMALIRSARSISRRPRPVQA
jgi:hypothetical protein